MWPLFLVVGCSRVDSQALQWTEEREQLTVAYARRHTDPAWTSSRITPRAIVLHGTTDPTVAVHLERLRPPRLPAARTDLSRVGTLNVSVHYAVDRDGTVTRVLDETRYARHIVGLNHAAIGIEHMGDGPEHDLTAAQVAATANLVRDLAERHPIRYLHGHHELVDQPERHPLFVELDPGYRTIALDPGDAFVEAIASRVEDLGLRGSVPVEWDVRTDRVLGRDPQGVARVALLVADPVSAVPSSTGVFVSHWRGITKFSVDGRELESTLAGRDVGALRVQGETAWAVDRDGVVYLAPTSRGRARQAADGTWHTSEGQPLGETLR